ncbi:MAG: hypothetical protein H0T51_27380 [Pirellulales bacterium]|nr:hypothetical protein [Pirellulales bacterium]
MAVLQSLSLGRMNRLIGALLESPEFELVRFQNQPSKGSEGVPDAVVFSSCRLLIETKTTPNQVRAPQLSRHLVRLNQGSEAARVLLVLTPDGSAPKPIQELDDPRIVWASFARLDQSINELIADPEEVISEREEFLLREFQAMLTRDGLVASAYDVVVVAARRAWPQYLSLNAYCCQANRTFQQVERIAFYTRGIIQPSIPKILDVYPDVLIEQGANSGRLGDFVNKLLTELPEFEGERNKIFLLSGPDSSETVTLQGAVPNDLVASTGRPTAYTQGQRYVSLEKLQTAKTTSDLVDDSDFHRRNRI